VRTKIIVSIVVAIVLVSMLALPVLAAPPFPPPGKTPPAPDTSANKLALVVGISQYRSWNTLPFGDKDARDVYKALTMVYGFPSENVRMLRNRSATKTGIIDGLNWLATYADSDDTVVIYISGHGTRASDVGLNDPDSDGEANDEAIVPYDTQVGSFFNPSQLLWDEDFGSEVGDINTAANIWVSLDISYSGGFLDTVDNVVGSNRIVTTSSTWQNDNDTTPSYESSFVRNGVFTYFMVEEGMIGGLADGWNVGGTPGSPGGTPDDEVQVEEAFYYSDYWSNYYFAPQNPNINDQVAGLLSLQ
jgi:hypothetical protein